MTKARLDLIPEISGS